MDKRVKFKSKEERCCVILLTWFKHHGNTGENLPEDKLIKRYSHTWEFKKLIITYRINSLYNKIKDGMVAAYLKHIVRM